MSDQQKSRDLLEQDHGQSTVNIDSKDYTKDKPAIHPQVELAHGNGKFYTDNPDTANPKPLLRISFEAIRSLLSEPASVAKGAAPWVIFSDLIEGGRTAEKQRQEGRFYALWGDSDEAGAMPLPSLQNAVASITGGAYAMLYHSRSATPENLKSRIIIPIAQPVNGADFELLQEVFNDLLAASGVVPDRTTEAANQVCYLPNRGEVYDSCTTDGPLFNPLEAWADQLKEKREAEEKRHKVEQAAKPKPRNANDEQSTIIGLINAAYDFESLLQANNYRQRGKRWLSPFSESGAAGVAILSSGRLYSHHGSSDPLSADNHNGHSLDVADVLCALVYGGDLKAMIKREANDLDPEGQKRRQREYMEKKAANMGESNQDAGTDNPPPPHPLARFIGIDSEIKPPDWILSEFIQEGLVTIAGDRGVGKTTTIVPLSLHAAGFHPEHSPIAPIHWRHVVYISEDPAQVLRIVAGAKTDPHFRINDEALQERFHLVEAARLQPDFVVAVAGYYKQFIRTVDGLGKPVELLPLVVFDTMAANFDLENENDNAQASSLMAALKQKFAGYPAWLITHVTKASREGGQISARGGSALEGDAHQVLYMEVDSKSNKREITRGKTRFETSLVSLQLESKVITTSAVNRFGGWEVVTLRWNICHPMTHKAREVAREEATEARKEADKAQLRERLVDAVRAAYEAGEPPSRTELVKAVTGNNDVKRELVADLLTEGAFVEFVIPKEERKNPRRTTVILPAPVCSDLAGLGGVDEAENDEI